MDSLPLEMQNARPPRIQHQVERRGCVLHERSSCSPSDQSGLLESLRQNRRPDHALHWRKGKPCSIWGGPSAHFRCCRPIPVRWVNNQPVITASRDSPSLILQRPSYAGTLTFKLRLCLVVVDSRMGSLCNRRPSSPSTTLIKSKS
jgi:hypothetical protein